MADPSPGPDTSSGHALTIEILTWFLFTVAAMAYSARLAVKIIIRHTFLDADDFCVTVALVLAAVQSAAVTVAAMNGLGRASQTSSPEQLIKAEKYQYVSQLLWVLSLCFARLAYLCIFKTLTPAEEHRIQVRIFYVIVAVWGVVSLLVTAFQCSTPQVWNYLGSHCIDRPTWFISLDALNCLLDAALIALPIVLILPLRAKVAKKLQVMFFFSWVRVFVIAASICDAIFWSKLRTSTDQIQDVWIVVITTETVQTLNIIAVSSLYLKPFIQMLQSGFLRIDDMHRRGSTAVSKTTRSYIPARFRAKVASLDQTLGLKSEIVADQPNHEVLHSEGKNGTTNFILTETTLTMESDFVPAYLKKPGPSYLALAGQPLPSSSR